MAKKLTKTDASKSFDDLSQWNTVKSIYLRQAANVSGGMTKRFHFCGKTRELIAPETSLLTSRSQIKVRLLPSRDTKQSEPIPIAIFDSPVLSRIAPLSVAPAITEVDLAAFLAVAAHELRNPLAPLSYALQAIATLKLSSEAELLTQLMRRQVEQLVHLVDNLLESSKLQLGKIELKKERCLIRAIVESAVEATSSLIKKNGQSLTVVEHDTNTFVKVDASRIIQVISNLLTNAAKYSRENDHIELDVCLDHGTLTIKVIDDGIGIEQMQLPKIFQLFAQMDRTFERGAPGLGIGLSLVKSIVELHGGTVVADSQGLGYGTVFTVEIPVTACSPLPETVGCLT